MRVSRQTRGKKQKNITSSPLQYRHEKESVTPQLNENEPIVRGAVNSGSKCVRGAGNSGKKRSNRNFS